MLQKAVSTSVRAQADRRTRTGHGYEKDSTGMGRFAAELNAKLLLVRMSILNHPSPDKR